jgi:hypothetical protein
VLVQLRLPSREGAGEDACCAGATPRWYTS